MPYIIQITDFSPMVRTYFYDTIYYEYQRKNLLLGCGGAGLYINPGGGVGIYVLSVPKNRFVDFCKYCISKT